MNMPPTRTVPAKARIINAMRINSQLNAHKVVGHNYIIKWMAIPITKIVKIAKSPAFYVQAKFKEIKLMMSCIRLFFKINK